MVKVTIKGRNIVPIARLLEALTKANLLSSDCVWSETDDSVTLLIKSKENVVGAFQKFKVETI